MRRVLGVFLAVFDVGLLCTFGFLIVLPMGLRTFIEAMLVVPPLVMCLLPLLPVFSVLMDIAIALMLEEAEV